MDSYFYIVFSLIHFLKFYCDILFQYNFVTLNKSKGQFSLQFIQIKEFCPSLVGCYKSSWNTYKCILWFALFKEVFPVLVKEFPIFMYKETLLFKYSNYIVLSSLWVSIYI